MDTPVRKPLPVRRAEGGQHRASSSSAGLTLGIYLPFLREDLSWGVERPEFPARDPNLRSPR